MPAAPKKAKDPMDAIREQLRRVHEEEVEEQQDTRKTLNAEDVYDNLVAGASKYIKNLQENALRGLTEAVFIQYMDLVMGKLDRIIKLLEQGQRTEK